VNLDAVTIKDIEDHKLITADQLNRDLDSLRMKNVSKNENSFRGNDFLYHHQLKNLLKCKPEKGTTIYDQYSDPIKLEKLLNNTKTLTRGGPSDANNIFECWRMNNGRITMFKATTAKYLYQKYNAKSVLDPTAGWGGRMLGAWALDIDYIGIDTNLEMIDAYNDMMALLNNKYKHVHSLYPNMKLSNLQMIWQNALDVDFSQLNYDFVLTSPPYVNLELYEHMTAWESDQHFYTEFLIPLWQKCIDNIKANGHVCFNISPKMYDDAIEHGLKPCDFEENFKQQMGQLTNKKKQDKIYIWEN